MDVDDAAGHLGAQFRRQDAHVAGQHHEVDAELADQVEQAALGPLPGQRVTSGRHVLERHPRSEEHTSELQSPCNLVCRLLLEQKKPTSSHVPQLVGAELFNAPLLFLLSGTPLTALALTVFSLFPLDLTYLHDPSALRYESANI